MNQVTNVGPSLKANDRRGTARYTELAIEFLSDFPIGTRNLEVEKIDRWFHEHGVLEQLPLTNDSGDPLYGRNSDAWLAHLQRRHQEIKKLNKSSAHPRLLDSGSQPFTLTPGPGGTYSVRSAYEAITGAELPKKVLSLTITKRKQLRYLMESADWSILPPWERAFAEAIDEDIDAFQNTIEAGANHLGNKLARLETKIRQSIASGEIKPANSGIQKFLEVLESPRED